MKVGTDGVLLGAWVDVLGAKRILDIGTGTGLLALMAAQRSPAAQITAIEPHHTAFGEAVGNVAASAYGHRIELAEIDINDYRPPGIFDLIISNPPFFEGDLQSPDPDRSSARHASGLTPQTLADAAHRLAPHGRLATIYPPEAFKKLESKMVAAGWHLVRRTDLKPVPKKPVHRILSEFAPGLTMGDHHVLVDTLVIRSMSGGPYSEAHKKLTSDFYLDA